VERAFREGKCAILTDLGHADGMENDVDRIEIFQGLGIRRMGIVYSGSNALGGGSYEIKDGGLTNLGYDAVMRMNKVGMLIDVSHAGDVTAMETIQASKDPVCISHRGSRNLNTVMPKRMAPDEVLQACAEKGGVVGVVVAGYGLRTKKHPDGSIEGFLEHMGHLIDILGIDHVGAGPDTIYTDHAEYYRNKAREQAKGGVGHYSRAEATDMWSELGSIVAGFDYVKGLESVTDFPNIIRGLVRDGYSDGEIAKVAGRNALRLLRKYSKLNDDWQLEFVRVFLRLKVFK
jgi:membrane dipeptidase